MFGVSFQGIVDYVKMTKDTLSAYQGGAKRVRYFGEFKSQTY